MELSIWHLVLHKVLNSGHHYLVQWYAIMAILYDQKSGCIQLKNGSDMHRGTHIDIYITSDAFVII